MELREALLRLRNELGLSQKQCANAAGISLRSYARYESGNYRPRAKDLKRLAEFTVAKELPFLGVIFEGELQKEILAHAGRVQTTLRTAGDARRIPFFQLNDWQRQAAAIQHHLDSVFTNLGRLQEQVSASRNLRVLATQVDVIVNQVQSCVGITENLGDKIRLYTSAPTKRLSRRESAQHLVAGLEKLKKQFPTPQKATERKHLQKD